MVQNPVSAYSTQVTDVIFSQPCREVIREPVAEFFGVMILILFGNGVDAQVSLSANTAVVSGSKGVRIYI